MCLFFFNDTATTEIYTLSLHDALPIWAVLRDERAPQKGRRSGLATVSHAAQTGVGPAHYLVVVSARIRAPQSSSRSHRSEEHTSELQSRQYLVCRLLLEKKKETPSGFI